MASGLLRLTVRQVVNLPQRCIATSSIRADAPPRDLVLDQATRDRIHYNIGNREVVGYGMNGTSEYFDIGGFPFPSIRFKENTPELMALREKEKGDWKLLTIDEKKTLYRSSFCQTFSEMNARTGEWKAILAGILTVMGLTGWTYVWARTIYPPLPETITDQWKEDTLKRVVVQGQGKIMGISSHFDYEKNDWKD